MKKIKLYSTFTLLLSMAVLSGCASMFGNNSRQVKVSSNPPGAVVYVGDTSYGITPTYITLPNYIYGGLDITLKKKHYVQISQRLNPQFQWVSLLNLLNGFGFFIDGLTGDLLTISDDSRNITITLRKSNK